MKSFPPRLHVIPAAVSSTAIIIRRGPAKEAATFSWNLKSNEIKIGQWFKGRIYEYRCDISSDGRHFIYAAYGRLEDNVCMYAVVSKAPYLKALDLYSDIASRGGGGYFVGSEAYKLNEIFFTESKFLQKSEHFKCINETGEHCLIGSIGIYLNRLEKQGWEFESEENVGSYHSILRYKKHVSKNVTVRKLIHSQSPRTDGKTSDWEEAEIEIGTDNVIAKPNWEWCELLNGRLYWAESGFLKSGNIENNGELSKVEMIHDFNGYKFERIGAPY